MSAREAYKQLLIAESEINRHQLIAEVSALRGAARGLVTPSAGWQGLVGLLSLGASAWFRRGKNVDTAVPKRPWLRMLLAGVDLFTVWRRGRRQDV